VSYDWDFAFILQPAYLRILLRGLGTTLYLTAYCIIFGTLLGVLLGTLCALGHAPTVGTVRPDPSRKGWRVIAALIRGAAIVFVDVVRAVPLLLLILTSYYALPLLVQEVSPFACATAAMSINLAAFVADLVRGSAEAVNRGSVMAARGLGMTTVLTWRRIILPEVIREILPSLVLLYITMLKMSTLASVVTVYELLHSAESIVQETYKPLELYVAVCILFVAVVLPLAAVGRRLERTQFFLRRSLG
jgi:polar amino acid transport system permease protein